MKWFAGCDHAGLALKQHLVAQLRAFGDEVEDLGTHSEERVDYPEFGAAVGAAVVANPGTFGLLVCGSGIGISIAANRIAGVRAALVHDAFTAEAARAHNDANILVLGQRVVGTGVAEGALTIFRNTPFAGGRHEARVAKLDSSMGTKP